MIHLDKDAATPLADQVVMQMAGLISEGRLPSGTRLPSIRKLATELVVSSATVVAAYDRLIARGLVESRASSGFFVAPQPLATARAPAIARGARYDAVSMMRVAIARNDGAIPASGGFLPETWLEDTLSSRLLASIARQGRRSFVNPGCAEGYAPLRSQLSVKLSTLGIPASPEQVLMTFGCTQAFDLIARALLSPGDVVAVEEPGYFGLHAQLQAHGVRLIPIARGADGPDTAQLAEVCTRFRPRLFFTQTLLQNPTGSSTSPATAAEILRVAGQHDLLVVEDDIYGDLFPGSQGVRLAQLDRLQRVIYVASFSKLLSPNVRVGYLAAPVGLIESFVEQKLLSVLATSEFDERLVYTVLANGGYRKHVERVRNRLAQNKPAVLKGLESAGLECMPTNHASVFAWAKLPDGIDSEVLIQDAVANGYLLMPGAMFFVNTPQSAWMRFNMAHANDQRLFSYLAERLPVLRESAVAKFGVAREAR